MMYGAVMPPLSVVPKFEKLFTVPLMFTTTRLLFILGVEIINDDMELNAALERLKTFTPLTPTSVHVP